MRLASAIDAFLREPFAVDTRRRRNRALQKFLTFVGDTLLTELTIAHITSYRQSLTGSDTMRWEALRTIKAFLGWVAKNTDVDCLRSDRIEVPRIYSKPHGCFSHEEITKLREAIETEPRERYKLRDRAIFEVMYSTGFRRAELLSITVDDLDRAKRLIRVVGKGNKPATCYLTQRAVDTLDAHIAATGTISGPVFRLHANALHARFREWGRRAGLKTCHPHMLRKSFATHMWQAGADVYEVSRLARHENINTTQRYILVTEEHDRQVHAMYHGDAKRFTVEKREQGQVIAKVEVYAAEGVQTEGIQAAIQMIVDKLSLTS